MEKYNKRFHKGEVAQAHIEHNLGYREFRCRGINSCENEVNLFSIAYNLKKIQIKLRKAGEIKGYIQKIFLFLEIKVYFWDCKTACEGGATKNGKWKPVYYLPYEILRKKWRDYSLGIIKKHIEMTEKNQMTLLSIEHQYVNGFDIKKIKEKISKKELVGYIAIYIRHPPISNRRIVDYNGSKYKASSWIVLK